MSSCETKPLKIGTFEKIENDTKINIKIELYEKYMEIKNDKNQVIEIIEFKGLEITNTKDEKNYLLPKKKMIKVSSKYTVINLWVSLIKGSINTQNKLDFSQNLLKKVEKKEVLEKEGNH
jgi:hypothetical protein